LCRSDCPVPPPATAGVTVMSQSRMFSDALSRRSTLQPHVCHRAADSSRPAHCRRTRSRFRRCPSASWPSSQLHFYLAGWWRSSDGHVGPQAAR
jgi:hypothetical protein